MENYFKGLAHISMFTNDIKESIEFYTQNLGFTTVYEKTETLDIGPTRFAFLKLGDLIIEFLEPEDKRYVTVGVEGTINHYGIKVTHLEEIVKDLESKNVEFLTGINEMPDFMGGIKVAFIKGPTGEKIELFEYTGNMPF